MLTTQRSKRRRSLRGSHLRAKKRLPVQSLALALDHRRKAIGDGPVRALAHSNGNVGLSERRVHETREVSRTNGLPDRKQMIKELEEFLEKNWDAPRVNCLRTNVLSADTRIPSTRDGVRERHVETKTREVSRTKGSPDGEQTIEELRAQMLKEVEEYVERNWDAPRVNWLETKEVDGERGSGTKREPCRSDARGMVRLVFAISLVGVGSGGTNARATPVDPLFAVEQGDALGEERTTSDVGQTSPLDWSIRTIYGALLCSIVYHLTVAAKRRLTRVAAARSADVHLPAGSEWKTDDGRTRLCVDAANSGRAELAHSRASRAATCAETWELQQIRRMSHHNESDLVSDVTCPAHGGSVGTALVHLGAYNELRIELRFAHSRRRPLVVVLHRIHGRG